MSAFTLGVSSFGTAEGLIKDKLLMSYVLEQATATINSVFCIGYRLAPETGRAVILFASVRRVASSSSWLDGPNTTMWPCCAMSDTDAVKIGICSFRTL